MPTLSVSDVHVEHGGLGARPFTAMLQLDGRVVAIVSNVGRGGPHLYHPVDRVGLEVARGRGGLDARVDVLVDAFEDQRWMERVRRTPGVTLAHQ